MQSIFSILLSILTQQKNRMMKYRIDSKAARESSVTYISIVIDYTKFSKERSSSNIAVSFKTFDVNKSVVSIKVYPANP